MVRSAPCQAARLSRRIATALAALPLCVCSSVGPGGNPEASEAKPPILAAADPSSSDAALVLEGDNESPAPLAGQWTVATGGGNCSLTLTIDGSDLSGQTVGCSQTTEPRPIAIGLVSGGSFLFQTGRGGAGWIWSGSYNFDDNTLRGRREHVITGELESFVARR